MARHVASVVVACPRCGGAAQRVFVAESRPASLRFSSSLTCERCGWAEELDGASLDDDARQAFYASEGRWALVVRNLGSDRLAALRLLRAFREVSPAELARFVDQRAPLIEGALVEMEQAELVLGAAGIDVSKSPKPGN